MSEDATQLVDYIHTYDDGIVGRHVRATGGQVRGCHTTTCTRRRNVEEGLERSAWTGLDIMKLADGAMKGFFIAQIETYLRAYNARIPLRLALSDYGSYQPLHMKRCRAGSSDAFQPHSDAICSVSHRYMVSL